MNNPADPLCERERALSAALHVPIPKAVQVQLTDTLRAELPREAARNHAPVWLRIAAAAAVVTVLAITAALWPNQQNHQTDEVYAAVVKAIAGVDTMHMSGWTTEVEQRWQSSTDENLRDGSRYPMNTWEWTTDEGDACSYSEQGPIIIMVKGDRRYEYDTRTRHLAIVERHPDEMHGPRFRAFHEQFEAMEERGVVRRSLGTKTVTRDGAPLPVRGLAWERPSGTRGEIWIGEASGLPVEMNVFRLIDRSEVQVLHAELRFDVPVPAEILNYEMPEPDRTDYDNRIDPRFDTWHRHLKTLDETLSQQAPLDGMRLIPRESKEEFEAYYPGRLPNISATTNYWVRPIQRSLGSFVEFNWDPRGLIKIDNELADVELNHDLITSNDFTTNERVRFVVENIGLTIVETTEEREVWVATHDGRLLKPWKDVLAPIQNPDNRPLRPGMRETWGGDITLGFLLETFALRTGIPVVDETSLGDVQVSSESPYWNDSDSSIAVATKWFLEEFGVTLTKESRDQPAVRVQRP